MFKKLDEKKLTTATRNALPKSVFAGPDRSYPIPDKSHAIDAKGRATQAVNAGRMSKGEEEKIDAKANRMLDKKTNEEALDELSRHGMLSRYIRRTRDAVDNGSASKKRKEGYSLALKKKWGDKKYGLDEPKIKATNEETMNETVRNIITSAMNDNAIEVQSAIHAAIGEKIQDALEAKRVVVAQNLVGMGENKK